jgi:hypothetical protein
MTIAEALLPKLADWRPVGEGRHAWSAELPDQGWTVRVTADRVDSLGCLVWELNVHPREPRPIELAARARAVAGTATGLLEQLSVHEIDSGRGIAVLRSSKPAPRGEKVAYYEVHLTADGAASVRRFQAGWEAGRREQVAFALTYEALAKLAGDLAA